MPKITKRVVDALQKPEAGEAYVWDSELRGFGIRIMSSGVAAYLIRYRNVERRTRKLVLGRVGTLTPDEARGVAREKLTAVARGEDPAAERSAHRKGITVKELCHLYMDAAGKGLILGKRGAAKKASTLVADLSRIGAHIVPLLGTRKVSDLTRTDVTRFMRDVAVGKSARVVTTDKKRGKSIVEGGKGASTRTLGLLGGMLSFAVSEGILPSNPVHGVKRPADNRKQARLTPETYRQVGKALEKWEADRGSEAGILAIRLLLLTGCRRGEIEKLKWSEVDAPGHALRLEDSKEGASVRPIGQPVLDLLEKAKRSGPYVCSGPDPAKPYGGLRNAWNTLAKAAGLVGITLHTLRHSFASTAADLGYSEPTIGAMIGHASGTMTGRYVHHLDAVLVGAADRVAAEITRQMK